MQQLSGLDAAFLAMESPDVFLHIGSVCVVDPSTAPEPLTLARLRAHLAARQHLVPLMHRRLIGVPLGLDQPYWVDEDRPDLRYHVRQVTLPPPGDDGQLADQVARLHARPLDRSRPMWELHLITGLAGGRAAVYAKVHHSAMDGKSGDDLLAALLDPTPSGRSIEQSPAAPAEAAPGSLDLLLRGARSLLGQPARAVHLGTDLLLRVPWLTMAAADRVPALDQLHHPDGGSPHLGLRGPHTPFNAAISGERRWAVADLSLTQVQAVKAAAGVTVNDVVMALCAGALRRWLQAHQALPDQPLIAAVPVATRTSQQTGSYGNHLSAMFAALPTNVAAPEQRLAAAAAAMRAAKAEQAAVPPTLLTDVTGFAPPFMARAGWRWSARWRLLERINPFNLFISNVPGPRIPLYYAGALVQAYYPVSAIAHGQGLNITVCSYRDRLCFGLLACPKLVPDLDQLADWLDEELQLLQPRPTTSPALPAVARPVRLRVS
jgi:diacylglycerol O-acyltransferase / wax synthase